MKTSLQLRLGPQLTMTPQLQHAIKLLQLSTLELNLEINTAIEANPLLELADDLPADDLEPLQLDDTGPHADAIPEDLAIDTNWEDIYPDTISSSYSNLKEQFNFDTLQNNELSLQEHLTWQLNLTPFSDQDRMIATAIIDSIDDAGYLSCSLEDLHANHGVCHIASIISETILGTFIMCQC